MRVEAATGPRSCRTDTEGTGEAVYEFWPSDLEAVFRRAGIALRKPPPWSPECDLDATAASGHAPRIVSPQRMLTYDAAATPAEDGSVLFAATTDVDAQRVFWFVNGALVAEVPHRLDAVSAAFPWADRPVRGTAWRSCTAGFCCLDLAAVAQLGASAGTGAVKRCGQLWWVTLHAL